MGAAGGHHRERRRSAASRPFPCHGGTQNVHRIEIPHGRFERQIGLPLGDPRAHRYAPLELVGKVFADGVLTLVFKKKEIA